MKRMICTSLAVILLMCACAAPAEPVPEETYPLPEGLFSYYNLAEARMGMGYMGTSSYGLISAEGEVVIPCEYSYIGLVSRYDYYDASEDIAPGDRFFIAHRYPEITDVPESADDNEEPTDDIPDDMLYQRARVALISPEGKFLTGFDYYNIFQDDEGFIGQLADDESAFVRLDSEGKESELDQGKLTELRRMYSWMWEEEVRANMRTGPDVPEQGFDYVVDLPGGNYWGAVYINPEPTGPDEPAPGKGEYLTELRLYSAEGKRIGNAMYNSVDQTENGLYIARKVYSDTEPMREEAYILDEMGTPLAGPYDQFYYWGIAPYLIGVSGNEAVIIDTQNFYEIRSFSAPDDSWINTMKAGNRPLATVSVQAQSPQEPLRIYMLDNGEEIVFDNLIGYGLNSCNAELTRFIVAEYSSGKGESSTLLVNREGTVLAEGYDYMYGEFGLLNAYRYDYENGDSYNYIMDWDGNVLLGEDYSAMSVLPGKAVLAVRGDWVGIVDLDGNWVYRESIFQNLDN